MPTTDNEADRIICVCSKYLIHPTDIVKLAKDLHEQVGKNSKNWSVRETMRMRKSVV